MKIGKRTMVVGVVGAMLLVVAGLGIACGGGDKKEAKSPEDYALQVCDALSKYADDMETLLGPEANFEDPEEMQDAMAKMGPLLKSMSSDLDKISPPSDIKDWHEGMVAALSGAADLFGKMKDALDKPLDEALAEIEKLSSEMDGSGDPFESLGELPEEYQTAFDNNSKCQELDIFNE